MGHHNSFMSLYHFTFADELVLVVESRDIPFEIEDFAPGGWQTPLQHHQDICLIKLAFRPSSWKQGQQVVDPRNGRGRLPGREVGGFLHVSLHPEPL